MIDSELIEHLSLLSGSSAQEFRDCVPVGGGSINQSFQLRYEGHNLFLKVNDSEKYPGMFEAERKGLDILRKHSRMHIPEVMATGNYKRYSFILMHYIYSGRRRSGFFSMLGEGIAQLHSVKSDTAGLDHSNYIGSLPQQNGYRSDCISFFTEERLLPMIKRAKQRNLIPAEVETNLDKVIRNLPSLLPDEKASLLHGDLWSGNYMTDAQGHPCLIDPAVYYGHREADVAMTKLFGGFDDSFYEAYNESYPLIPGWKDRMAVWNLYPLLVHLNLFGESYLNDIRITAGKYA